MRVGNASTVTPFRFYTKLTPDELIRLRARALLKQELYSNEDYESFTVRLPSWYSKGQNGESPWNLHVDGRHVRLIYTDNNNQSAKPGVEAEWIIRLYHRT